MEGKTGESSAIFNDGIPFLAYSLLPVNDFIVLEIKTM
jgi:hypothetical protein